MRFVPEAPRHKVRLAMRWLCFWTGILFILPIAYWALCLSLAKAGMPVEGWFFQLFEDLMSFYFRLPATCFGNSHFSDSVAFYSPLDSMGVLLFVVFYIGLTVCLTAVASLLHKKILQRTRRSMLSAPKRASA